MAANKSSPLAQVVTDQESSILTEWIGLLRQAGTLQTGRITETELQTQCRELLQKLKAGLDSGFDASHPAYAPAREYLTHISRSRALQGFSPRETATFVFSLKLPIFNALSKVQGQNTNLHEHLWQTTLVLDELGLGTMEAYQKTREEVIIRQQREIAELSTPVVKLWDGVLALPLIGTLDSERTQVVMENLLQSIVEQSAQIAIIDITGVPTVDTLTAQHLLKTIAAARLMGADCIISGIRPQIAQTMVHLGVELNVISKATLADAFAVALRRMNRTVAVLKSATSAIEAKS
ncbi:MAG: STAS domain-containing protein [Steroidobacteraceae bacterium]